MNRTRASSTSRPSCDGVSREAHQNTCSSTWVAASRVRARVVCAMIRARHPATRPDQDRTPEPGEAVGDLDTLGQEPPRTVVGATQHGRELRHTELVDRRRPLAGERLRGREARLRELRVRDVQVGPVHRQAHHLDVGLVGGLLLVAHRAQQLGRGVRQSGCGGR